MAFVPFLFALLVVAVPRLVFPSLTSSAFKGKTFSDAERQSAMKDRNALQVSLGVALLQIIGGTGVAFGVAVAWRQMTQTAKSSQVQSELDQARLQIDRMARALDDLGEDHGTVVRMGGLFTLGRIAESFTDDRSVVADVLSAYVRLHSDEAHPVPAMSTPIDALRELRHYRPDVQAAMSVLGRHTYTWYASERWRFRYANLRGADLTDVQGLLTCDLADAVYDRTTSWPKKFQTAERGAEEVPEDAPFTWGRTRDGRQIPAI